ncbi:hypothetical protein QRX50_21880 [Amycolatopsis carbonis]|uniref:Uncharacterized protein n=1 Tax=Amycolatopsis carbonis TaxID=715471 RepID=A0A9Y2INK8_9PSEU|nr:hypothetical protein [Amycolatopsis sp. 2-15]WIX83219.1 hypothetical protein QRX50_21880 [Amycolatopsis sp. 2-15]
MALKLSGRAEQTGVQIDPRPLQPERLTATQAERESNHEAYAVSPIAGRCEYPPGLHRGQWNDLVLVKSWRPRQFRRIDSQASAVDRDREPALAILT